MCSTNDSLFFNNNVRNLTLGSMLRTSSHPDVYCVLFFYSPKIRNSHIFHEVIYTNRFLHILPFPWLQYSLFVSIERNILLDFQWVRQTLQRINFFSYRMFIFGARKLKDKARVYRSCSVLPRIITSRFAWNIFILFNFSTFKQ